MEPSSTQAQLQHYLAVVKRRRPLVIACTILGLIFALFLGLLISNTVGVPNWLKPAVQTEFYIKTGLVILGTALLLLEILQYGALGILQAINPEFDSDDLIDARLVVLGDALANLRAQGSSFGSNLSIVQNRQDFTKAMINTLETGADNLVLADSNEEGANMLALQTRQQLSTTALSLSAQADQAVLRLFG